MNTKTQSPEPTQHAADEHRELVTAVAAPLADSGAPDMLCIVPWGTVRSTNGDFIVDEDAAEAAVKAFKEHACDLPVDYEHQTLGGKYSSPSGQAPAAGWLTDLHAEPNQGLMARVRWTEPARAQITARQYRFLSPVALVRREDRKLLAIHSVALTNKPAIVGMAPIVNRQDAIRIEVDAQADVEVLAQLREQLSLPASSESADLLVAAAGRIAELEKQKRSDDATKRIEAAGAAGKLSTAQREWAYRLILADVSLFDEWLRTAPVLVQTGRIEPPSKESETARTSGVAAGARAEYRANRLLADLTSEEAYIAAAIRGIGRDM